MTAGFLPVWEACYDELLSETTGKRPVQGQEMTEILNFEIRNFFVNLFTETIKAAFLGGRRKG